MSLDKYPRICISAGHGKGSRGAGSDPGAEVVNYVGTEDDLVLNAAKSITYDLQRLFQAKGRGKCFLRNSGAFYLADDYAVKNDCDVFVELHTNAGPKSATGTSVIYESNYSAAFAEAFSRRLSQALNLHNEGAVHRTDLAVLNPHSGLKQVLVEMFYGSNAHDVEHWKRNRNAAILAMENAILANRGWKPLTKRPKDMSWAALKAYKPF